MFSKDITNSSEFQMMSPSAQALYFHIGMNADDDGFCEVFTIVRMTESKPDDLRSLHERGLIYLVDSKVGIVKDWHTNNDIRSDRYTRSKYLDNPQYGDVYMAIMEDKIQHLSRYRNENKVLTGLNLGITGGTTTGITQDRLGKDRIPGVAIAPQEYDLVTSFEEEKPPKKPSKYPNAKTVFSWFPNPQKSWALNTTELKHAELLFDRGEDKVKSRLRYLKENEDSDFLPSITKPSDLERKWVDLEAYAKRNR